jgi:DNA-binding CsgD family transcriptional regulator
VEERELMKRKHNLISITRNSGFQLDPSLSSDESIVLRALADGKTDRQVCRDLGMDPNTFLRLMREMRIKIGAADNVSLVAWAIRRIQGGDQRIYKPEDFARLA